MSSPRFLRCLLPCVLAMLAFGCGGGGSDDPCADVVCDDPPAPSCIGANAVTRQPGGECIAGQCAYEEVWTDCPAMGQVCSEGTCVDPVVDPCDDVVCDDPPEPACDGDEAVVHALGLGVCDGGTCTYTEESRTDCAEEGQYCEEGACVDADPCADVACDTPPDTRCRDGNLEVFEDAGVCFAGLCTYYVERREFCADDELGCDPVAETCVDLCDGVVCDDPPADHCDGYHRVTYADAGDCAWASGDCVHEETRLNCSLAEQICDPDTVTCVDPCEGVVCDDPPDAHCDPDEADVAVTYTGSCAWYDDGECEYTAVPRNCAQEGKVCADGACVD